MPATGSSPSTVASPVEPRLAGGGDAAAGPRRSLNESLTGCPSRLGPGDRQAACACRPAIDSAPRRRHDCYTPPTEDAAEEMPVTLGRRRTVMLYSAAASSTSRSTSSFYCTRLALRARTRPGDSDELKDNCHHLCRLRGTCISSSMTPTTTSAAPSCSPVSRSLLAVFTSSQRPLDAYLFHHQDSLPRQGAMLVPPALLGHPCAKRGVVRVLLRHIAVPVLALEGQQLLSLASVSNCCPPWNRGTAAWSSSSESSAAHRCDVPNPLQHPALPHSAPSMPSRCPSTPEACASSSYDGSWPHAQTQDAGYSSMPARHRKPDSGHARGSRREKQSSASRATACAGTGRHTLRGMMTS